MQQDFDPQDSTFAFYEGNAKPFYQGTVNINMSVLYAPFLAYLPPYASILDAGCGSGRDTLFFASRGYRVTAFDYAPALVKLATKLTGQQVLQLSFQDMTFKDQFDGVWACSSLLHIPMDQMNTVLSKISGSLKLDGALYASFNYGKGEHFRNQRRFVDFDEDSMVTLIEGHPELTILRCWRSNDLRPDRKNEKWLNLLARKALPTE